MRSPAVSNSIGAVSHIKQDGVGEHMVQWDAQLVCQGVDDLPKPPGHEEHILALCLESGT
jgi:hypothetical protein